jgi:hypothetical protein
VVDDLTYQGVLLSEIQVDYVDWTEREDHIRFRSTRMGNPDEMDIEPEWATEAATDPDRLARERDSGSLEVVGLSPNAPGSIPGKKGRVLRVWIRPIDGEVRSRQWVGQSACAAAPEIVQIYRAAQRRRRQQ